jgi:hypothetical protein
MRSVMSHNFAQVPQAEISRSVFDRSHGLKTTFDAGYLVPIFWDEVLPGDTHKVNLTAFARLATPIVPIMDNLIMDFHFFEVSCRLLYEDWKKLQGEQIDPGDSTDYLCPTFEYDGAIEHSLVDYFGLPINTSNTVTVNAMPFRAYYLIWNDWYRDENLQDSLTVPLDAGPDYGPYYLLRRGKRRDYFTACLPWTQKGDAVELPLGSTAPVEFLANGGQGKFLNWTTGAASGSDETVTIKGATDGHVLGGTSASVMSYDPDGSLYANLATATAATINTLRLAFQTQRILERDARGGTRYIEAIKARFGVTSPDFRMQRPVYLGGGSIPVGVHQVPQTTGFGETGDDAQGNMAAYGQASGNVGFTSSHTEHGYIIGLVSVRADLTYDKGIDRMWSRSTRFDFFEPALAHIGEQAVLNQEIYFDDGTPANNTDVFGYQEAFADYRFKKSVISGLFRTDATGTLSVWHLCQDFTSLPTLNSTFIQENPPVDRVIATPSEPHFLYDSYIKHISVRPMPVFSVPGLIDHF